MFAASDVPRTLAYVIAALVLVVWLVYVWSNVRAGHQEAGSEIELAPNRKPYYDDEVLEGRRLERVQLIGLGEPVERQAGAIVGYNARFASWGSQLFASTADGGFNCAGCHGGMGAAGGSADYTVTDPTTGEVKAVKWLAPALNTVMYRFDDSEVRFILTYGRPYSPMSPWGLAGGGPMNDQQIDNLIAYLKSIQLPEEGCTKANPLCKTAGTPLNQTAQAEVATEARKLVDNGTYKTLGEALFNLDLGSGAYSCARCHTKGWSYSDPQASGGGAMGPNLTGGSEVRQFPVASDQSDFICKGSEVGKKYGSQGQGSGKMPGFCGILTQAEIDAIVEYERGL
jgi:mono/diheme cytochrome c family protein